MKHLLKVRKMKKYLFIFVSLILMACEQTIEKSSLSIAVEGMSCGHSCAPFIEKKLNQIEGVLEAKVSFEKKSAEVTINTNEVSKEEIIKKIESIANGQYQVKGVEEQKAEEVEVDELKETENSNDGASSDFDVTKPEVSSSTGFQLPNIFSLLNSLLN